MRERIASLKGGMAIIKVGGRSDFEVSELRDRVEDSLFASKAALEDGFVIGGGCALLYASESLNEILSDMENEE
jgi:chaperonin GroEL